MGALRGIVARVFAIGGTVVAGSVENRYAFGDALLISSPTTMFANTGPGLNSNSRVRWSKIARPVMSVGCRSGVHWIRANVAPSTDCAIARARIVFAVPGTSSSST